MKQTNKNLIKRINSAKKRQKHLTHVTDKTSLSTEDKMKLSLCRHFVQFVNNKRLKLKQVAEMMGIPVQRLSEITNYKISKFSVGQLLTNLSLLAEHDAPIREYLSLLEQAAELPTLKVKDTRRLARDIKEAGLQYAHA